MYLNSVGTYGLGSTAYWWRRLGALIQRLALSVVGHPGLRWLLRLADDYLAVVRAECGITLPLLALIVFVRALGVPLKWSKFRGDTTANWIGHHIGLAGFEVVMSDSRWALVPGDGGQCDGRPDGVP